MCKCLDLWPIFMVRVWIFQLVAGTSSLSTPRLLQCGGLRIGAVCEGFLMADCSNIPASLSWF